MNLAAVSEEIRATLDTIDGLRAPEWGTDKVNVPAALVTLPERIDYDETFGHGLDSYPDLAVVVLGGPPTLRQTVQNLSPYTDGSGTKSIYAVLEGHAWATCDSVEVDWAEFTDAKYAGVDYLAAVFHLKIIGKGV